MLRRFQEEFLKNALAPSIDTAALSLPRGNGKTWLAAYILRRCLTPGDPLYVAGAEYLLCAASIEQARLCFRFIRLDLEPLGGYRFIDSATRIGITHTRSNTRLRVLSSNGKTAMGIVGCPVLVADEPGSWEVVGGTLMFDAIQTAQGKPGSPLKVIYIGTLAPASPAGGTISLSAEVTTQPTSRPLLGIVRSGINGLKFVGAIRSRRSLPNSGASSWRSGKRRFTTHGSRVDSCPIG